MVDSKRSSKGLQFSMKMTPVAVPFGDLLLGFKHPPTLIGKKPSILLLLRFVQGTTQQHMPLH